MRTGSAPAVLAGVQNAEATVLRASGVPNLAAFPHKAAEVVTRFVLRLL